MRPASDMHARFLVRTYCGRHIDETPAVEEPVEWIGRAMRTEAALNAALCARVNRIHFNQVICALEELRSVHAGTHPDIVQNATLTINNVPELLETLNTEVNEHITELLTHAEKKVPA